MDISESEMRENWEVKKPEEGKKKPLLQTRSLTNEQIDKARDQQGEQIDKSRNQGGMKENGKEQPETE